MESSFPRCHHLVLNQVRGFGAQQGELLLGPALAEPGNEVEYPDQMLTSTERARA